MAERDYPAAEVGSVWDVDATAVVEEAIPQIGGSGWTTFVVPVQLGRRVPLSAA